MKEYSVAQVAELFDVHKMTVYRWIDAGHFPGAHKLTPGGQTSPYRIPEEDIEAFKKAQRAA